MLLELKARFDEESNIEWARALEREGVHVIYGLVGLKVHSKIALVVRREGDVMRRYVHLGTGNYNPQTARIYTDLSLFTCDEQIGADATDLFNYLTGYSAKTALRKLLVAPVSLRQRAGSADPSRNRAGAAQEEGAPHFQDERAGRSGDDQAAVPGLASRHSRRPAGARPVLPAARRSRRQRKHHASAASSAGSWNTRASTISATAGARKFTWAART